MIAKVICFTTGFAALVLSTAPAAANQQCLSQIKTMSDRAGLVTDLDSEGLIVFSSVRKTIDPIHAFARGCLRRAYQKTVTLNKRGKDGRMMHGLGFASKTASGITWCEYPDLGPLGGYGSHRTDWTIWISCGGGSGGAASSAGGDSSTPKLERGLSPAFGALGGFLNEVGKAGQR